MANVQSCSETLKSKTKFQEHCRTIHEKDINYEENKKYRNILLLPGLGHFGINIVKSLFKLLWPVCIEDLAKIMGFRSIKALTHCQAATNHHQSWQILQILLHGTAKELILPYLRHCIKNKLKCSAEEYFKFTQSVRNPCYIFMCIAVFTYLFAAHLFRCAMRKNNHTAIAAARYKISPLYYGLNMRNYQEIEFRDRWIRCQAPEEVKQFVYKNECISVSGHGNRCESGDFVLESQNRRIKRWMPPGIPNIDRWERVCRNLDRINKIKERMMCYLDEDIQLETNINCRHTDLEEEIFYWQKQIREKKYLENLFENKQHISMSGQKLDENLVNFSTYCRNNQKKYFQNRKNTKLTPLFVTFNDRQNFNDIKNKTKEEIVNIIEEKIDNMECPEEADIAYQKWNDVIRKSTKATMIAFYKTIP